MELKEYLRQINISPIEFAYICKISHPVLYRILAGKTVSEKSSKIVYKKTNKHVNYQNIYIPKGCPGWDAADV